MGFQFTLPFILLSITAILSSVLGFTAWQHRSTPARSAFAFLMIAVTGYAVVAAMESAVVAIAAKIFWSKLEYVGSGSVIVLFLLFSIYFTHQENWLTRRQIASLWIVPLVNMILVATNEWHHLIWVNFLPGPIGSNQIIYQHGPGFIWVMLWVYLYTITGSILLAQTALRSAPLYRRQARIILLGSLMPIFGSGLYMLGLAPPGLNLTPLSFSLAGLFFAAGLFRFRLFDLVPIARDTLVENMNDGVLVVDARHRLVDLNPAARRFLGFQSDCVGRSVDQVLDRWPQILHLCYRQTEAHLEIWIDTDIDAAYVDLRVSLLRDRRGRVTGQLMILRDITYRHRAEMQLRQANERLQAQLMEIATLQVKLQEQAIRDRLTGLFNRHYLDEYLPHELERAVQEEYPISLILLDIDHFKSINDTYGHQAGDRVLQAFSHLLLNQTRTGELACRLGGEEFLLVFPGLPMVVAYERAEHLRLAFAALQVAWQDTIIQATVSGGLALFPQQGETPDQLLCMADHALYAAKASGRNCIKVAQRINHCNYRDASLF